jgi:hypothetical protein
MQEGSVELASSAGPLLGGAQLVRQVLILGQLAEQPEQQCDVLNPSRADYRRIGPHGEANA